MFNAEVIAKAKRDLGSWTYNGQHQQRPAPEEGGLFQRSWWQYYKTGELPSFDMEIISVDCAFKGMSDSDFVAIHSWGCVGPRRYLIERLSARMNYTATKQAIKGMIARHPKAYARLIEDKANGSAIISELQVSFGGIIAINPEGGKLARAWACSPDAEAKNYYLPADDPLVQELVEQAANFPNAANDDDVDAFTQAFNWYRSHNGELGLVGYLKEQQVIEDTAKAEKLQSRPAAISSNGKCPKCDSDLVVRIGNNMRCNACGNQYPREGAAAPQMAVADRRELFK
jgi:predicted phage terminase large subunit-like protein